MLRPPSPGRVVSGREGAVIRHWLDAVSQSALPFERRWTQAALHRVDPTLAGRLHEQRNLFAEACVTGLVADIELHGAATVRGWAAATSCLEKAAEPDDAYMLGVDSESGLRIAIGSQVAAADRVREVLGEQVVWVTPDECAKLLAGVEAFKFVGAVRKFFPSAELIDRHLDTGT